jgi:hypothetical protein
VGLDPSCAHRNLQTKRVTGSIASEKATCPASDSTFRARADVADCLNKTLDDRTAVKKILGASN